MAADVGHLRGEHVDLGGSAHGVGRRLPHRGVALEARHHPVEPARVFSQQHVRLV